MGGVTFAATMMILVGAVQAIQGLTAIFNDEFFVTLPNHLLTVDITTWGWIHLALGVVTLVAGFYLLSASPAAAVVAIVLAVLSAISNFMFIPYYPFWSILVIILAVWVIWSISNLGMLRR